MLDHFQIIKGHGVKYHIGYGELFGYTFKHFYDKGLDLPEVRRVIGRTDLNIDTIPSVLAEKEMGRHSKFLKAP